MTIEGNRELYAIVWDPQHRWNERAVDWSLGPLEKISVASISPKDGDPWNYARVTSKDIGATVIWVWTTK